jgi:carbonic anhydrase/acetyltransferase-like protein (isoleucine patch superfamily)
VIRSWEGHTPIIHPTAFVSEAAYIVGRAEVGEGSSIWPGTVIRGDLGKITIGRFVNLQDNCVAHSNADATYGDYISLGHGVVSHARHIESYVLVGNGAVLNDGVEVGEYSIIAAGAVVLENKKIPPHSFVAGVPAEVRGPVTERHIEMIRRTAEAYVQRAKTFKHAGLGDPTLP